MSTTAQREGWIGRTTIPVYKLHAECRECELTWDFDSATRNPETYCPFCESEEPIRVKEVK